jgi:glutathione S-transferase
MCTARLITIPFSHYCEKARWSLDRMGIPYVEEGHLPILHLSATIRAGGRSTPLLAIDGGPSLTDSKDILRWADESGQRGDRLFPEDCEESKVLESQFDEELGPHARRLGYSYLLEDSAVFSQMMTTASVPFVERRLAGAFLPLMKFILRSSLNVSPAETQRSRDLIAAIFDDVAKRLADNRPFLCGDRFTGADITFASLAAPLVMPQAYAARMIPLSSTNSDFREEVERWRQTPAGEFALRLFKNERHR